ncbi:MAG: 3-phosphoshikimate 1-carboxyvinyltransferase [Gemmatimonadetes bacterium]|nr:3-phosphoshikimate 1-carboxyvinyltransferase [Gemmatimonadota bacterium]
MRVGGVLQVPGDKSISHRALMLAALGAGASRVRGLLQSLDVHSTAQVLRALGVPIPALSEDFVVEGVGLRGLQPPTVDLDCGNSGTTARLMAGIVAGSPLSARFIGDASLSRRPMRRVKEPLTQMGARFECEGPGDTLPMTIHGAQLLGMTWHAETASAQVKSAILLAGLVADVPVEVHEPVPTRDHTERMLMARGVDVRTDGGAVTLVPSATLNAADQLVPGDPSSAAFFAALAALADTGELALNDVCINPTRAGAFRVLRRMGARVTYEQTRSEGGEEVARVIVGPGTLRGTEIGGAEVPSLIDELPILACVAACADGETRVTGAHELRVKESDRIKAIVDNLRAVGAEAEELPDGFVVRGVGRRPFAGRVTTHGDHRIAMAFGVLGAIPGSAIIIDDPACAAVSFPTFWEELSRVVV